MQNVLREAQQLRQQRRGHHQEEVNDDDHEEVHEELSEDIRQPDPIVFDQLIVDEAFDEESYLNPDEYTYNSNLDEGLKKRVSDLEDELSLKEATMLQMKDLLEHYKSEARLYKSLYTEKIDAEEKKKADRLKKCRNTKLMKKQAKMDEEIAESRRRTKQMEKERKARVAVQKQENLNRLVISSSDEEIPFPKKKIVLSSSDEEICLPKKRLVISSPDKETPFMKKIRKRLQEEENEFGPAIKRPRVFSDQTETE